MFRRILIYSILTSLTMQMISCDENHYVDIVCAGVDVGPVTNATRCFSYTSVEKSRTIISKVMHQNGSNIDTKVIDVWQVPIHKNSYMKFIPAGIKQMFPNLSIIILCCIGLIHLEREDMRQFGGDLTRVEFQNNSLTALEGDIFEFNPNIKSIHMENNPIKFINPMFFESFKEMKNLKYADLSSQSGCVTNSYTRSPQTIDWKYEKCIDEKSKTENLEKIKDRTSFFHEIFPGYQIMDRQIKSLRDSNKQLSMQVKKQQEEIEFIRDNQKEFKSKLAKIDELLSVLL